MTVRAKAMCINKTLTPHQKKDQTTVEAAHLRFRAVNSCWGDKQDAPENAIFGEFTPGFELTTYITNHEAHQQFEVGKAYYIDFTPAE